MFSNGFPKEWSTLRKLAWLYRTVINAVSAVLKTIIGNPIHITDALAKPVQALSIALEPIQDLHGYDNPWPAGGGANKWNEETELGTISTIDGQDIASTTQIRTKDYVPVVGGNRYCVVTRAGAGNGVWTLFYDSDKNVITSDLPVGAAQANNAVRFDNQGSINVPVGCAYIRWYFQLSYGATYLNDTALNYPSSVTTYTPYSNICPISGHTDADVIVSPTLNPLDGTTYPIPLGQTVYGGTLNVLTGVLTVTHGIYTFSENDEWTSYNTGGKVTFNSGNRFPPNIDTTKDGIMSNYPFYEASYIGGQMNKSFCFFSSPTLSVCDDAFSDATAFATSMVGQQLVYKLATPQTIQLTPQQVELLQGENNIWSDGTMTLVYLADGNASDVEALNILLGGRYVNNHTEDEPTDREALGILLGRTR